MNIEFTILEYSGLNTGKIAKKYHKVLEQLRRGDFQSAEVKKLKGHNYFRAKIDDGARVLFRFGMHRDIPLILIYEIILNHNYDKSVFLRGRAVDDGQFEAVDTNALAFAFSADSTTAQDSPQNERHRIARPVTTNSATTNLAPTNLPGTNRTATIVNPEIVPYINRSNLTFHVLDKPISFDELQSDIFLEPLPLILIGSAGSGKTALALEKLKLCKGRVLYTSLSSYLVENAANLLQQSHHQNEEQEIEFCSFQELIETIEVPVGRPINFAAFANWALTYGNVLRKLGGSRKLYEEFQGVLCGSTASSNYLTLEEYRELGIKQSIFPSELREEVYDLFCKYVRFLGNQVYYDPQIVASTYRKRVHDIYDYLVVDEVQDFTVSQLGFVFAWLKNKRNFILTGDANQIVHPNFFSWSKLKSFFYEAEEDAPEVIRILRANFRNSNAVIELANKLLLLKQKKFGSIDRDSNYLASSTREQDNDGSVRLLPTKPDVLQNLNEAISRSAAYAVVVLNDDDKIRAKTVFSTPLIFSVHEAKGLEYPHVILFRFLSTADKEFRYLAEGITPADLDGALSYSRNKDKSDKSLEIYKFYINSLYVGITRGVKECIVVEDNTSHPLLSLLYLRENANEVAIETKESSIEEWEVEAHRLEKQGKLEQAEAIRKNVLHTEQVPWELPTLSTISGLLEGLKNDKANKRIQNELFTLAYANGFERLIRFLAEETHCKISQKGHSHHKHYMEDQHYSEFLYHSRSASQPSIQKYGINHRSALNETPLMTSARLGYTEKCAALIKRGASPHSVTLAGLNAARLVLFTILNAKQGAKYVNSLTETYSEVSLLHIRLRVDGHLVKIERGKGEYLLFEMILLYLLANPRTPLPITWTFSAMELESQFSELPTSICPKFRTERKYISALLSKNELNSNNPYSRHFLKRLRTGIYTLPDTLEVETEPDTWLPWQQLLGMATVSAVTHRDYTGLHSWHFRGN